MATTLTMRPALRLGSRRASPFAASPAGGRTSVLRPVVCAAGPREEERSLAQKLALPAAALLGAALLMGATPDVAEAARSGGRVGGSSGFSARRSAPAPSRSYSGGGGGGPNIYVAPPVYGYGMSPFGFGVPFFGGGFGYGVPLFGGFSFIFNIMIFLFIANVVLGVVRNFTFGDDKDNKRRRDDDDDGW